MFTLAWELLVRVSSQAAVYVRVFRKLAIVDYGEPRYGLSRRGGKLLIWPSRVLDGIMYKFARASGGAESSRWYCSDCHTKRMECRRTGVPCGSVLHVKVQLYLACQ